MGLKRSGGDNVWGCPTASVYDLAEENKILNKVMPNDRIYRVTSQI